MTDKELNLKVHIEVYIKRMDELLALNLFQDQARKVYWQSVMMELLVTLNDLLTFCDNKGMRVTFTDDINQEQNPYATDITDFIRLSRNALCHLTSEQRELDPNYQFVGFPADGLIGVVEGNDEIGYKEIMMKKQGDVTMFIGKKALYLQAHIVRAFEEAREKISQYYSAI